MEEEYRKSKMVAFSKIGILIITRPMVGSSYCHRVLSEELTNLRVLPCGSKVFHRAGQNRVGEKVFPLH